MCTSFFPSATASVKTSPCPLISVVWEKTVLNEFEQLAQGWGHFHKHVEVNEDGELSFRLASAFPHSGTPCLAACTRRANAGTLQRQELCGPGLPRDQQRRPAGIF
jgi:hypothetical protein